MQTAEPQASLTPLGGELLSNYVAQFAENQRSREQSFLKIVGFLGAVSAAYAYVYREQPADPMLLPLAAIVVPAWYGRKLRKKVGGAVERQK